MSSKIRFAALFAASLLSTAAAATTDRKTEPPVQALASGLQIQDLELGDGAEARPGSTVEVHYTGWLADGTVFDASRERGRPLAFRLDAAIDDRLSRLLEDVHHVERGTGDGPHEKELHRADPDVPPAVLRGAVDDHRVTAAGLADEADAVDPFDLCFHDLGTSVCGASRLRAGILGLS